MWHMVHGIWHMTTYWTIHCPNDITPIVCLRAIIPIRRYRRRKLAVFNYLAMHPPYIHREENPGIRETKSLQDYCWNVSRDPLPPRTPQIRSGHILWQDPSSPRPKHVELFFSPDPCVPDKSLPVDVPSLCFVFFIFCSCRGFRPRTFAPYRNPRELHPYFSVKRARL